jgi:hypothetical protein
MVALISFLLNMIASLFKSKSRLEAENAALRHQLIVLQRKVRGRVPFTDSDRLFFVGAHPRLAECSPLVRGQFVEHSSSIRRTCAPASAACRRSKSPRRVQSGAIPLEAVRALIGDAVPILTRDPLSAAKSFVEESAEREELEQLTDRQLLRRAAREVAIAVCWSPKRCCAKRPWC